MRRTCPGPFVQCEEKHDAALVVFVVAQESGDKDGRIQKVPHRCLRIRRSLSARTVSSVSATTVEERGVPVRYTQIPRSF